MSPKMTDRSSWNELIKQQVHGSGPDDRAAYHWKIMCLVEYNAISKNIYLA